ncbi:MAG: hypothetical protein Q4E65_05255 [Clostridia bacterium]|nr:hypothetical protein [Clostridia bacterium]
MKCMDFDDALPIEVRRAVHETEVCQQFLLARQRVGALAESILQSGSTLHDSVLVEETKKLERMADALSDAIRECAYAQFYQEEFGR